MGAITLFEGFRARGFRFVAVERFVVFCGERNGELGRRIIFRWMPMVRLSSQTTRLRPHRDNVQDRNNLDGIYKIPSSKN